MALTWKDLATPTKPTFVDQTKFILAFIVMCLIFAMVGGEKALTWFLVVVLASMIVLNASPFKNFINLIFS